MPSPNLEYLDTSTPPVVYSYLFEADSMHIYTNMTNILHLLTQVVTS